MIVAVALLLGLLLAPARTTADGCMAPPAGLVGWWSGDGHFLDLSTNGNHAAYAYAVGFDAGVVGHAFRFGDSTADIRIPPSASLDVGTGAGLTVEMWVRPSDTTAVQLLFEWDHAQPAGWGVHFAMNLDANTGIPLPGSLFANIGSYFQNSHAFSSPGGLVTTDRFHHVALTYDRAGGDAAMYVDGTNVAAANLGLFVPDTSGEVHLGVRAQPERIGIYTGLMDEVTLYNRALAPAEIAAIHAAGAAGKRKPFAILAQPRSGALYVGVSNALCVTASTSEEPLAYQWQRNGTNLPGRTAAQLSFSSPQFADAGNYRVVVSNSIGATITSQTAAVTVKWAADVPTNLVGWWPGDGHFFDLSTNGRDAAGINGIAFAPGRVAQAFDFNGIMESVDLGPWFDYQVFTVSLWVKAGPSQVPYADIMDNNHTEARGWVVQSENKTDAAKSYFGWGCAGVGYVNFGLVRGQWHHLALAVDASHTGRFYFDGALLDTLAGAGPVVYDGTQFLRLGQWGGGGRNFNGAIDEVAIFDRDLTAEEVAAIHGARSAGMRKDLRILVQPQDGVVCVGVSNTLGLIASGTGALTCQWRRSGTNIAGQTNAALCFTAIPSPATAGYDCIVTDVTGAAITSRTATVTVQWAADVPADMTGWWPGDGHYFDLTANRNHGVPEGGPFFSTANVGQGFAFDSDDDRINVPHSSALDMDPAGFTAEFWMRGRKEDQPQGTYAVMDKSHGWGTSLGWVFQGSSANGSLGWTVGTGLGADDFVGVGDNGDVLDGAFHHIAGTWDGATLRFYRDGREISNRPFTTPGNNNALPLRLGCCWAGGSPFRFFRGVLDELSVYRRALSAGEIAALYAAGAAGKFKTLEILSDLEPLNRTRAVWIRSDFWLVASGTGAMDYRWRRDGVLFTNTTAPALSLINLTPAVSSRYDVVVHDAPGNAVTSRVAVLTVVDRAPRYDCLYGWWPGEGDANDALGVHHATLVGDAGFTNGIIGQAFRPANGYVDLGIGPALDSFAVETWVWVDPALNLGEQRVVSHDNPWSPRKAFLLKSSAGAAEGPPVFEVEGPSGGRQAIAAPHPLSAGWHHLVGVRDTTAGVLALYVDGAPEASAALTVPDILDSQWGTVLSGISSVDRIEPFHGLIDEVSLYTCALSSNQVADLFNLRPVPPVQTNLTIDEMTLLSVTNAATDNGRPFNVLSYTLAAAPNNAVIGTNTGMITWTPTEAQGPGTGVFTTVVTDNGIPPLKATNSFSVAVREVNRAPAITPPATQTVNELTLLTAPSTANDPDLPANGLTFALVSGPTGLEVNAINGIVTWTPGEAQGPATRTIRVSVTDTGVPPLAATGSFTVVVNEVNVAPVFAVAQANRMIGEMTLLTVTNVATDADLPINALTYTLAAAPNNAVIGTNTGVITWTPTEAQGPGTGVFTTVVTDNGIPPLKATNSFSVAVREVNRAPAITPPAAQTVNELTLLTAPSTASDPDLPANGLTFALVSGPTGLAVNAINGIVTWTPSEAQGPTTKTIRVSVTDDGVPPLAATGSFTVVVNEVNAAPVLIMPSDRTVHARSGVSVWATATDTDLPSNALVFAKLSGPAALLVAANGQIRWTPADTEAGTTNTVAVTVVDNGTPPLADTNRFRVIVVSRPIVIAIACGADGNAHLTWTSLSGQTYRAQCAADLSVSNWLTVGADVAATGGTASVSDALSGTVTSRFYRVRLSP
jgi:hypothetical protein